MTEDHEFQKIIDRYKDIYDEDTTLDMMILGLVRSLRMLADKEEIEDREIALKIFELEAIRTIEILMDHYEL
jgi:metal-sulfur cluster biosynthetic enzyme